MYMNSMSFVSLFIVFVLVLAQKSYAVFEPTNYDHSTILNEEHDYTIYWTISGSGAEATIALALQATNVGWMGFGIAEQTSGSMPGADIVTFSGSDIQDRHTLDYVRPTEDICQDWELVAHEDVDGTKTVEITRLLDTGDTQDRPIEAKVMRVIYAFGEAGTDSLEYHGESNRQMTTVDFSGGEIIDIASWANDNGYEYVDINNNYVITATETVYHDEVFDMDELLDLEGQGPVHIVALQHLIDDNTKENVHHFVVEGSSSEWYGDYYMWAWAGDKFPWLIPEACGFKLSSSDSKYLHMETHYDNAAQVNTGETDTSGIRVYYTRTLRDNDCGVVQLGDPSVANNNNLEAGITRTAFNCPSDCVPDDVTVFGALLHMHAVGQQMWTEHFRDGESLGRIDSVHFWDVANQVLTTKDTPVLAGDSFHTVCIHETTEEVEWGLASLEEMCIQFLMYYPRTDWAYCGMGFVGCGSKDYQEEMDAPYREFGTACGEEYTEWEFVEDDYSSTSSVTDETESESTSAGSIATPFLLSYLLVITFAMTCLL